MGVPRLILLACLALLAAFAWLSFIGNGMAFGDTFGLPGREHDLAAFRLNAYIALGVALSAESLLVGVITWACSTTVMRFGVRLLLTVSTALMIDALTFAVVK